jgi:hypothetical protein
MNADSNNIHNHNHDHDHNKNNDNNKNKNEIENKNGNGKRNRNNCIRSGYMVCWSVHCRFERTVGLVFFPEKSKASERNMADAEPVGLGDSKAPVNKRRVRRTNTGSKMSSVRGYFPITSKI